MRRLLAAPVAVALYALAIVLGPGPAAEALQNPILGCNVTEDFNAGIPPSWSVINNAPGNPVVWTDIGGSGEAANYTGASENAATASSALQGGGSGLYDTELRTPEVVIPPDSSIGAASIGFSVNYQNFAGVDRLDWDISTDGGGSWTNLLSFDNDRGGFRMTPGNAIAVQLTQYRGQSVILRWHYYDPTGPLISTDWYAQIDDVELTCTGLCMGELATITGTPGPDVINGTSGTDIIAGLEGNDTIKSYGANDLVCGGRGNDTINGGGGDDTLRGQRGDDTIAGGPRVDDIDGGPGDDDLNGGSGNDRVKGGDGADTLNGGPDDDFVSGAAGNDDIRGAVGDDVVRGGPGNDSIRAGGGNDQVFGDDSRDRLLAGGSGNDQVFGGNGDDNLQGNFGLDVLQGQGGNDTLNGGIGIDSLVGGGGTDVCNGGIDGAEDSATFCETELNIP